MSTLWQTQTWVIRTKRYSKKHRVDIELLNLVSNVTEKIGELPDNLLAPSHSDISTVVRNEVSKTLDDKFNELKEMLRKQ